MSTTSVNPPLVVGIDGSDEIGEALFAEAMKRLESGGYTGLEVATAGRHGAAS